MDRLFTVEVRWFFTDLIPPEVLDWFANQLPGDNLLQEKPRTDIYLIVQERDDLGLKLSRGSLELKWRQDARPFSLQAPPLTGVQETWVKEKWRYAKKQQDQIVSGFNRSRLKGWRLEVSKTRAEREYKQDNTGKMMALPHVLNFDLPGEDAPVVKIELTTLHKSGETWWTLGMETASNANSQPQVFEQSVKELLKDYPRLDLQTPHSYGYPQWVAQTETSPPVSP